MSVSETTYGAGAPASQTSRKPALSRAWLVMLLLGGAVLFCVYGTFRQRYIWGADSFGYYALGELLSRGHIELSTEFPPDRYPAGIPMGFSVSTTQKIAPDYPPGFPLALAVGHALGFPMYVTPFLGVISCGLMFMLLRQRTSDYAALLLAVGWAVLPTTVFGATMVMSDLVGATGLIAVYAALQRRYFALAAWLLAFSFAVRPSNVLFVIPLAVLLPIDRQAIRFGLHMILPGLVYGAYNHVLYGAPWRTGYGNISTALTASVFPDHFKFYAEYSLWVLSPLIVALTAIGLFFQKRALRETFFLGLWLVAFPLFYSFWQPGAEGRWWWTRFLAPSYAAAFLLAADGVEFLRIRIVSWGGSAARRIALAGLFAALAAVPVYCVRYGVRQNDIWRRDTGLLNRDIVEGVRKIVPEGGVIGTVEFASCFKLYTGITPFVLGHSNSLDLVPAAFARGCRVFLLVEPWNAKNDTVVQLLSRYPGVKLAHFDTIWGAEGGLPLYELKNGPLTASP